MVKKVVAIVQARVGSTRLRSKIFERIGHFPAISLLLKRLELSKKIDETIIATTDEDEDNQIVKGIVIALEDDLRLRRALSVTNNIEFFRYKVDFKLIK